MHCYNALRKITQFIFYAKVRSFLPQANKFKKKKIFQSALISWILVDSSLVEIF